MKYEVEINEMLHIAIPRESWMPDDEYEEMIEEVLKQTGVSRQRLSDEIEAGVKNGYTVEQQIEILKLIINNYEKSKKKQSELSTIKKGQERP